MYLYNSQISENKKIYLLFFLTFLVRVPFIIFWGDKNLENEWDIIINNLVDHGKFSLFSFEDFLVPNVFMPPLYPFYLYFFKMFNLSNDIYILVILFSQSILSSLSVIIFYHINKNFFSVKLSLVGAAIFSLLPLHVYACGQISSIILQSFLTITFFYFFFKILKKNNLLNICFLSLSSGLLILLRGEFIALFLLAIVYLKMFFKINTKNIIILIFLTFIVISPYLARNILVLETFTITKSIGYNLWKGNNPNATTGGNPNLGSNFKNEASNDKNYDIFDIQILQAEDSDLKKKLNNLPKNKYYDINMDTIFLHEGIRHIKSDPIKYFNLYVKKIFSFLIVDFQSTYPNYYHPLHFIPVMVIGIMSILGIIVSDKKSHRLNFLILYFLINISVVSIFFILPRYSLAIIPLQIIFSNIFLEYINKRYFPKP